MNLSIGKKMNSSRPRRLIGRWLAGVLMVGAVWSEASPAQVPKPPSASAKPAQGQTTQVPEDALGRTTPRGTVLGFLSAAYGHNFTVAAQYLDTRPRDKDVASLAEKLLVVLDRRLPAKLNNLSNEPFGSLSDPLDSRRELVGTVASANGPVQIYLERIDRESGPPIWLFSRRTLAAIPDVYEEIDALSVDKVLPEFLLERFYGFTLFGWVFYFVVLPLAYLTLSGINKLLGRLLGFTLRHLRKRPDIENPTVLPHPIRLLIVAAGIQVLLYNFSMSLVARQAGSATAMIMTVVALVWGMILINGWCEAYIKRRMERRGKIATAAILGPVRRVMDFVAVVIGVVFLLNTVGVDPSTALAGLGVGGIAVALAAQKTLENVIGGVSLIVDDAIRVGDFFKVDDYKGTIEAIGLRSTRIRTLDRTLVSIPNGIMATMALENYTARDSFWLRHLVHIRNDTAPSVLNNLLEDVRRLLGQDQRVLPASVRVRLLRFGGRTRCLELEIFAYVLAQNISHFLEIQEELLLQIKAEISANGVEIANPIHSIYFENEMELAGNPPPPPRRLKSEKRQGHESEITAQS